MRVSLLLVPVVTACGFTPADVVGSGGTPSIDAPVHSIDAAGSGSVCGDADGDGICDAVDDWPCGPKPTELAATHSEITIQGTEGANNIKLQNADTRLVAVHPNQSFSIAFDYDIYVSCLFLVNCRTQLEIGTDQQGKQGCVYDANVTGNAIDIGEAHGTWTSTLQYSAPGVYQIRLQPVESSGCQPDWAVFAPDGNATIALVCVQ
jgi:hypothetical protein